MMNTNKVAGDLLKEIWLAARGSGSDLGRVSFSESGELPSTFAVTDLAAASMGAAGLALALLLDSLDSLGPRQLPASRSTPATTASRVVVDRRLASFWFAYSLRPQGWTPAATDDFVMGDYPTQEGWIRLHTNAPHHRAAALRALELSAPQSRADIARAVLHWNADELEAAVIAQGGCAARMRSWQAWQKHPQGQAVLAEPLIHWTQGLATANLTWLVDRKRPLRGLKVLDMTRVLAGPSATRLLAGLGAQVLRVDPPWWDEPSLAPEMTLGKRCTRLDLRLERDREQWRALLSQTDIFVHGYRSDALTSLGLGEQERQQLRPGLVDISLDAYGFTGPWHNRRGFDSLVQMSMGIAQAGQERLQANKPIPLPVQALDHATGYLLATAALRGLETRLRTGHGSIARASLARTGALLMTTLKDPTATHLELAPERTADLSPVLEQTFWGPAQRLQWPVKVGEIDMRWAQPAGPLGSSPAQWQA